MVERSGTDGYKANEILCPHCGSENIQLDNMADEYWCIECWRWSDIGDADEQSQDEMDTENLAVFDRTMA